MPRCRDCPRSIPVSRYVRCRECRRSQGRIRSRMRYCLDYDFPLLDRRNQLSRCTNCRRPSSNQLQAVAVSSTHCRDCPRSIPVSRYVRCNECRRLRSSNRTSNRYYLHCDISVPGVTVDILVLTSDNLFHCL